MHTLHAGCQAQVGSVGCSPAQPTLALRSLRAHGMCHQLCAMHWPRTVGWLCPMAQRGDTSAQSTAVGSALLGFLLRAAQMVPSTLCTL